MQGSWNINFTHQNIVVFRCNCRHSMSQVHKDWGLWTQMVNRVEAMEKHSWPNGVTSWNDTVKFAQLVFGMDVPMENYGRRLPHASNKSFLLFARGACGSNTPLDWIEPHFGDIAQKEREIGNHNNPLKSQRMQAKGSVVTHYFSAQLTRAPCTCRTSFGADANHKHVPTASDMWINGRNFARLWDATLLSNFKPVPKHLVISFVFGNLKNCFCFFGKHFLIFGPDFECFMFIIARCQLPVQRVWWCSLWWILPVVRCQK